MENAYFPTINYFVRALVQLAENARRLVILIAMAAADAYFPMKHYFDEGAASYVMVDIGLVIAKTAGDLVFLNDYFLAMVVALAAVVIKSGWHKAADGLGIQMNSKIVAGVCPPQGVVAVGESSIVFVALVANSVHHAETCDL